MISPINGILKPSYTDKGNKCRKSNIGKVAGALGATSLMGLATIVASKNNAPLKELFSKTRLRDMSIFALCAVIAGQLVDDVANGIIKFVVDKKANKKS